MASEQGGDREMVFTRDNWDLSPQHPGCSEYSVHTNFDAELVTEFQTTIQAQGQSSLDNCEIEASLKQEILHLEKRLSDQFAVRHALENALGYRSASTGTCSDNILMPKDTEELIKDISGLEMEVMYLEQYLLSLYRKAFNHTKLPPPIEEDLNNSLRSSRESVLPNLHEKSNTVMLRWNLTFDPSNDDSVGYSENLAASAVHRSYSALSQHSFCSLNSPKSEKFDRSLRLCHSQPLSFLENITPSAISLAEYLGTSIADHVPEIESNSEVSENLIRCICSVYFRIMDPTLPTSTLSSSSSHTSSCSSMSPVSPQYMGDTWNSGCKKDSSRNLRLENPYRLEGLRDSSGPYSEMVEVLSICTDSTERLKSVEDLLRDFRLLVQQLEKVDVKKMKYEEKLAFWINIHNALVMHAYVEYGISRNYLKRSSLLLKAVCNVGGHNVNAETIQNTILRCRTHRPGQWLKSLLSPKLKSRADELQSYAVEQSEGLVHFALCSGRHSDPAVRIYTAKTVLQQLDAAKEEYIRAAVSIRKEQKIMLPKLLESFARDMGMSWGDLVDEIQQYLPETLHIAVKRCQSGKSHKCVEWMQHNFTFRYLLLRDLTSPMMRR
ncbi:hypothetical protein ZOSMA_8G00910 [Zostera marina]|uniref:DUF547 domain-containing protein n=1 Tax=Zostera marina TaxID=29655 RepID=A0A0K9NJJ4_ZOSMR|nr:hypothetical protein ZOSMA_8G00910 [Zostera marina]